MNVWKRTNIGIKFIIIAFPVMALIVILFGWYFIEEEKAMFRMQLNNLGNSLTQATASFSAEPMLAKDYPMIKTYTDSLVNENSNVAFVYILRPNGSVVSKSSVEDRLHMAPFVYEREIKLLPTKVKIIGKVLLGISPEYLDQLVSKRIYDVAVASSVLFVVFSLVVFSLVRIVVTGPLCRLGDSADSLGQGNLDTPILIGNQDEVGRLAQILESMRINLHNSYSMIQKQNDRLKSLDKMKDEFLANMSHELKTPLNAIIGYSELAIEDVNHQQMDQLGNDLHKIEHAGRGLLEIVNNMLSLSSDAQSPQAHPYSLLALIEEIKVGFEVEVYKNKNKFIVQYHHSHDYVNVDVIKFKQMLLHLLNNANKFTHAGNFTLDVYDENHSDQHWVTLIVADNGIGIDEQFLDSVFLPFSQGDSSYTKKYVGTGLGLAVCKNLCRIMGGEISVESKKGVGSAFTVKLPLSIVSESEFGIVSDSVADNSVTAYQASMEDDDSIVNL